MAQAEARLTGAALQQLTSVCCLGHYYSFFKHPCLAEMGMNNLPTIRATDPDYCLLPKPLLERVLDLKTGLELLYPL